MTPLLVAGIGLSVCLGWMSGHYSALTWGEPISVKPTTAVCMILLGAILACRRARPTSPWGTLELVLAGWVVAIAGTASMDLLGLDVGAVRLLWLEPEALATESTGPGEPSVCTMLALLVLGGWSFLRHGPVLSRRFGAAWELWCWALLGLSLAAVVGHWTDDPRLYCWWPGVTSGVALPTAAALALSAGDELTRTRTETTACPPR